MATSKQSKKVSKPSIEEMVIANELNETTSVETLEESNVEDVRIKFKVIVNKILGNQGITEDDCEVVKDMLHTIDEEHDYDDLTEMEYFDIISEDLKLTAIEMKRVAAVLAEADKFDIFGDFWVKVLEILPQEEVKETIVETKQQIKENAETITVATKTITKADIARQIFEEEKHNGLIRKVVMDRLMNEANLSKAGAATYLQNYRKQNGYVKAKA